MEPPRSGHGEKSPEAQTFPGSDHSSTNEVSNARQQEVQDDEYVDVNHIQENIRERISTPVWILVVATMLSATFLFSLDNTIVADVQAVVSEDLGGIEKLSWLGVAFVLASSSTMTTWGKIYGIFSAKWSYITSIILFEIGSAICGAAPTMNAMIVGRAIAGFGGAGMYIGCLALLSATTSLKERPNYMAFIGITWGTGTVLGPVIGGAFAESSATWRWAFYINLCIGALFAPVYIFLLPTADPQRDAKILTKLSQLDFLGIVLNVGAFVALILAINFGGVLYAWDDGRLIALWVVGGVLLIIFALQQAFCFLTTPKNRTFPADFLNQYIMWLLFALMAAAATCVFVPTFYIPLFFQFVRGDSPLEAAVRLLPFICVMVFFGLVNGAVLSKFGLYMPWYLFGGIMTMIGGALMYTVDIHSSNSRVYGYSVLIGVGAGSFIQASFSVAQAKVPHSRASDASGYIALAQNLGIVLALAISGSIFQNRAYENLQEILPNVPGEALRGAVSGANSGLFKTIPPQLIESVLNAILSAMSKTYILVIVAGSMAIIGSLTMKRERLFLEAAAGA